MKTLLPLAVLAIAVPAAAQQETWPVQTSGTTCSVHQAFDHAEFGRNALEISYDASRQEVTLTTINEVPGGLEASGQLAWTIVFLDNGDVEYDDAWGERRFTYTRDNGAYRLSTSFAGERNVRQILADLANSEGLGFVNRKGVITGYELQGARAAIARLQQCAARAVAAN